MPLTKNFQNIFMRREERREKWNCYMGWNIFRWRTHVRANFFFSLYITGESHPESTAAAFVNDASRTKRVTVHDLVTGEHRTMAKAPSAYIVASSAERERLYDILLTFWRPAISKRLFQNNILFIHCRDLCRVFRGINARSINRC